MLLYNCVQLKNAHNVDDQHKLGSVAGQIYTKPDCNVPRELVQILAMFQRHPKSVNAFSLAVPAGNRKAMEGAFPR